MKWIELIMKNVNNKFDITRSGTDWDNFGYEDDEGDYIETL